MDTEALSWVKRPGQEANHPSPFSAEVKNLPNFTSISFKDKEKFSFAI
jgi:hypothetical protein